MEFALSEEHQMLKDLVRRFVQAELIPLERVVLEREAAGGGTIVTSDERAAIDKKSHELGLWGLDAPDGNRRFRSADGGDDRRQRGNRQNRHALHTAAGFAESPDADGDRE